MNVYLDWNATAPPLEASLAAMREAERDAWANPSSVHAHGRAARARVEGAREAVAELAGADPRDVLLTSGGTEANNLALRSPFAGKQEGAVPGHTGGTSPGPPWLVTSRLEHPSILRVAEALEREGAARLVWVRPTGDGRLDLQGLERVLAEGSVRLVTVQAVNPETGVIQPVADVARLAHAHGALCHVDAVQAWGRVPFDTSAPDSMSLAAHKMRGPKGVGALVTRPGHRLTPVLLGGEQERGLRPGTVDPIACAGLAVVARHAKTGPARYAEVALLRDELEARLTALPSSPRRNGMAPRAPHVTNLSFAGWIGTELVAALDLEGVSVSSGSACSAGTSEPSPVLRAMVGEERAASAVRLSMGETTTRADVDQAVHAFERVLARG
jgi:cysteine desulfurase